MSVTKFDYQPYKLYELSQPHFHAERPIILDDEALDSPETVILRYEEEAVAKASGGGGGDLRGDSSPGYSKVQLPQMHAFEPAGTYEDAQYQYAGQSFPTHQADNAAAAAAQLNQLAFAANGAAGQYMAPAQVTLRSYQPTTGGVAGSKIEVRISASYDLIAAGCQFFLAFGQHRRAAQAVHDASMALSFVVTGTAPHFEDTRSASVGVPMSLLISSADPQPFAPLDLGTFTFHDTSAGPVQAPDEDVTRRLPASHGGESPEAELLSPKQELDQAQQLAHSATNSFAYASTAPQSSLPTSTYDTNTTFTDNNGAEMMDSYGHSSHRRFSGHVPPPLQYSASSADYGSYYGSAMGRHRSRGSVGHGSHTTITRPGLSSLPAPSSGVPQLVRTSTIQSTGSHGASQYGSYGLYNNKAVLKINGELDKMSSGWTKDEWDSHRRIVLFTKSQQGSTLSVKFRAVGVNERPTNSICISCIWWAEKGECFVTSVDAIHLLEQLVAAPNRFTVEEKNRIRRNLEGFRPLTVSKAKADSEEFFKIIMGFPNPKPRNIEKDVKVFPWKILAQALKKIISKYSATASSTVPAGPALLTPVSSTSSSFFPQPPSSQHHQVHDAIGYQPHHDASHVLASPRSLSGAPPAWTGSYTDRRLSSDMHKQPLPMSPTMAATRIPTSSTLWYPSGADARQASSAAAYGMAQNRWDPAVTNGYLDSTPLPTYTTHTHHGGVYGTGVYGDAGRA